MIEEWRPIPNYEKWYEVSNLGRIKILAYVTDRLRKGVMQSIRVNEVISDPHPQKDGYRRIELHNRDTGKISTVKISKLVAEIFNNIQNEPFTHCDGVLSNDCADNIVKCADLLDYSECNWKGVVGFEDCYQVSDTGLIRNVRGKYLAFSETFDGYLEVGLARNGKTKTLKVHRVVAEAFLDTWDADLEVNHKDGNKKNNCVSNLEMVTHQDNMTHYWRSPVFAEQQKEYREYDKQAMTERWQNPEFRNKVQNIFDSPEYKAAHSVACKKIYDDPEQRKRAGEQSKQRWADPEYHDKQIEAIKKGWSDPSKRAEVGKRLSRLVWMTQPDGTYFRCPPDEVEAKLADGYVIGRKGFKLSKQISIYCRETDTTYSSMSECDRALGLHDGDTYHIMNGSKIKRLEETKRKYHLSYATEKRSNGTVSW